MSRLSLDCFRVSSSYHGDKVSFHLPELTFVICFIAIQLFLPLQDVFFSICLAVLLVASAGLLAYEANFRERHGSDFTSWFSDRLVGAVVSKALRLTR